MGQAASDYFGYPSNLEPHWTVLFATSREVDLVTRGAGATGRGRLCRVPTGQYLDNQRRNDARRFLRERRHSVAVDVERQGDSRMTQALGDHLRVNPRG